MNPRLRALALKRQALLARSAVARLQLHRDVRGVREALRPRHMLASAARTPTVRRVALGLALSLIGTRRASRLLVFAGRALLVAKVASAGLGFALGLSRRAPSVRYRTDPRLNEA